MASVTFIQAGSNRGVTGQTVEAFWNSISHVPLLSVGINCALGPKEMRPLIEEFSRLAPIYVSAIRTPDCRIRCCRPDFRKRRITLAPQLREWAQNGWLNIVGGCCGTTPGPYQADCRSREWSSSARPAVRRASHQTQWIGGSDHSGPESNFVNIGERTNVTGSPAFSKLILAGDYEAALSVARQQVEGGAQIIDINMDEGMLDSQAAMEKFLRSGGVGAGYLKRAYNGG